MPAAEGSPPTKRPRRDEGRDGYEGEGRDKGESGDEERLGLSKSRGSDWSATER